MKEFSWKNSVGILTGVYVSRMLGMFMVFPVFSLYAQTLAGANKTQVGIALGIYGLTQAMLQLPFGYFSDRFGRKPMLITGLSLFLLGTVLAAQATSITVMIIARAIQGMGAVSAVTLAYVTDVTPAEKRGAVMAIIGGSIGISFIVALIVGPILTHWAGGISGLFWIITAMLVLVIIATLYLPTIEHIAAVGGRFSRTSLWHASIAVLLLHVVFGGTFVVLPTLLNDTLGIAKENHWWIYLPANIIAMAFMRFRAEPHPLNFGVSFFILAIGCGLMATTASFEVIVVAITIFFIGFYRLETGLPHWVSQIADIQSRGRAMGYFSTAQFLGNFLGASLSGYVWHISASHNVFLLLLVVSGSAGLVLLYWGKHDTLTR